MLRRAHAGSVTETRLPTSTVAGFQLVRRLGGGTRAEVYLGVAPSGTTAAIKLYHPEVGRQSIAQELAALGRISSPYCVRLLDVAEDEAGTPVAVMSRVVAGSVARVLGDRRTIGFGEAVTILAPIAGLLPELHTCGVAHQAISAATVHFGERGEPVLLGLGHSHLFEPNPTPAVLEALDALARDRDRLALLAGFVLDRVEAPNDAGPLLRWLEALPRPLSVSFAAELEQRLFDRAGATAVTIPVAGGQEQHSDSLLPSKSPGAGNRVHAARGAGLAPRRPRARRPTREWVAVALGGSPLRALRKGVAEGLRTVRRPVWISAGLVAVALAAVLPLAATGFGGTAADDAPRGNRSTDGVQTDDRATDSAHTDDSAAEGQGGTADPSAGEGPSALPDDPVEALPLLLAERTRCIADLSVLCLEAVDQSGSTALVDDRALIEATLAGTAAEYHDVVGTSPVLRERLGDSALVGVGEQSSPASVLMIRTEAGWRVREIRAP
jgi:hypothetical protein